MKIIEPKYEILTDIYTYWPADDQTRKGSMVK